MGRKSALTASILLMAIPTALIGVLPSYQTIGIFAPLGIIIIRILQGISLGGEYSSSTTYLVESAPENKRAFFGSFSSFSLALGVLLSSLTVFVIEKLFSQAQILDFVWRVPFLLSAVYGIIGFYIRNSLEESQAFSAQKTENKIAQPFRLLFQAHKKDMLIAMGVFMGLTIPFYVLVVFSKQILTQVGFSPDKATLLNAWLVFVYMWVTLLSGYLSDKIGEKKVLFFSALSTALFAFVFFACVQMAQMLPVFLAFTVAGFLIGMFQGAVPVFSARSFPVSIRASGVSLSYNVPAILFGGTAPMLVTAMMNYTQGNLTFVAFYVMFGSICAAISCFLKS
jgi:MFS family permease